MNMWTPEMLKALDYIGNLSRESAKWWAEDNARYEATDPSFGGRLARSLNPMTGLGSAMGQMHTSAEAGDSTGMVLSLLQALPMYGVVRAMQVPGKGLTKASTKMVSDPKATLGLGVGYAAGVEGADTLRKRIP